MKFAIASGAAVALSLLAIPAANAAVVVSSVDGTTAVQPTPYYDFDGSNPTGSAGYIVANDPNTHAAPAGGSGLFYSVGPSTTSTGTLDFRNFSKIGSITFLWGSVDDYNVLDVLDRSLNVLAGYTISGGDSGVAPSGGNQGLSRLVTLTFDNPTQIGGLKFTSGQNAFEVDNFSFRGVPEPGTWAMMILGIGFAGVAMRRRQTIAVKYA
jgi:hypothetical protein